MSILKQIKNVDRKKNSTYGFYFGHSEAEGENKAGKQNLKHFFDDYLRVLHHINDEKFIFVGRKGAGKSAIAKHFIDSCFDSDDSHSVMIGFSEVEHEKLIQAIAKENIEDCETLLFEWAILVRLISLIVKNKDAIYTKQYHKLENFLKKNAGFIDIDKFQINELIEQKKWEINFEVLKHGFPKFGKTFDAKSTKAPFYKLIAPLKEIVTEVLAYEVCKDKEYWILFDDLDIDFKADNVGSCRRLVKLLRTAKQFNTSIFKDSKARVLLFLRDDAKQILQTYEADTAKIFSSYGIFLNWYSHDMYKFDENSANLKKLVDRRIALNFEAHNITFDKESPWGSLIEEHFYSFGGKTSFKYILDYTFYRPRDLILFLNEIGKEDYKFPLNPDTLKLIIKRFVVELVTEVKSELNVYLSQNEIELLFTKLQVIALGYGSTKEEVATLIGSVSPKYKAEELLKILLDYSILTLKDSVGNVHIAYREGDLYSNIDKMKISIIKGLHTYFTKETSY